MDLRRRRGRFSAVFAVALLVAQLTSVAAARADDTSTSSSSTTSTSAPSTSSTSTPSSSSTVAPTATAPDGPSTTVTIPTLQTGGSAPSGPPLPDPSAHIRVLLAQIEVVDGEKDVTLATRMLLRLEQQRDRAVVRLRRAQRSVAIAEQRRTDARAQLAEVATLAFMGAGGGVLSSMLHGNTYTVTDEREMVSATIQYHGDAAMAADHALAEARDARDRAEQELGDARADLDFGELSLHEATQTLAAAQTDLANANVGGTWALSIEGDSAFTAKELAAWFTAQGHPSEASVPIDQLAGFYVSEGDAEGVRGDMAFAQSMVETGSFTNPDTTQLNNFAGIGHCDKCPSGLRFDTAQLGVRGQIQLLKSYAEKDPHYANPLVDSRLHGPAGCCQTWTQLTRTWASDPNYGPKILGVYEAMLEWLLTERESESGPPPALVVSSSLVADSTTTTSTTVPPTSGP